MKKTLLKTFGLRLWMIMTLMAAGIMGVWAETSTLTFTAACKGSGTADDGAVWSVTSDGTESSFDTTKGIHYGTGSAQVQYIQLATSDINGTISKIVVNASGASGVKAVLNVTVGGNAFGTQGQVITSSAANYTFEGSASGEIVVTLTKPSKATKALYVKSIAVTYTTGGGSTTYSVTYNANGATSGDVPTDDKEYEDGDEVTVLGNTGDLAKTGCAFGGWNTKANGEGDDYEEDETFKITANTTLYAQWIPYTITALSNNESYGTVSLSGSVITATPATGYTYASPAYTVNPANSATIAQDGNTFTVTPTANTEVTINFESLPRYTVTFSDGGSVTQETPNAAVTLLSRSEKAGYTFAGWSETNVAEETTTAPTIIPAGSYTPTADITLYPVYSKTEGGGGTVNKTASVNIGTYASANTWSNGEQYETVTLDENVTATANGDDNTGKYYSSNSSWRFYANESATLVIGVEEGTLTSVTITYTGNKLTYNGEDITSGTALSVSYNSATIAVSGSSSNSQITAISVNYTISGGGTTYYWSAPVAAAVERPEIVVAQNPFLFSTTATISCETEDAAIKYSFDGETWNNYEEALTITETTTIYAKAVKNEVESSVASVTAKKNLAEPTVTVSGDLTVDLDGETDVEAGTLTASITYNEAAIEGAVVTWSSSNTDIATIDENIGVVTIKTRGTVTFTATYAGNSDYSEATGTKQITVTDSKGPGSEAKPYTVAEARAAIDAGEGVTGVYVTGIVSQVDSYNSNYHSITYWISEDGTTTDQFEVYSGKGFDGAEFSSKNDIQVGDRVVVKGDIKLFNTTYEFDKNNELVSLDRKVATPTFDPASGAVMAGTTVTISTATEGAIIYYTTNGDEPTTESTVYTDPITINEDQTIKAIAVKEGLANSDVVKEYYSILVTPTVAVTPTSVKASADGADGSLAIAYANLTISDTGDFAVQFYTSEDANEENEADAPDWIDVEVTEENGNYVVSYVIDANDGEARTAYFLVYAIDDETNLVYSNLVTITQEKYVAYYALVAEYNNKYYAINSESGEKWGATVVNAVNSKVINPKSDELSWEIIEGDDYIAFKNKKSSEYLGFTLNGVAMQAKTKLDDNSKWNVDSEHKSWTNSDGKRTVAYSAGTTNGFKNYAVSNLGGTIYSGYTTKYSFADGYVRSITVPENATTAWGTICLPSSVEAADISGAKFYSIAGKVLNGSGEPSYIVLTEETNGLLAGVPYIFEASATKIIVAYSGDNDEATYNNGLYGSLAGQDVAEGMYLLKDGQVVKCGTGCSIAANRAYIDMSQVDVYTDNGQNVKMLTVYGSTTGIRSMGDGQTENGVIYNLAGQRVEKATRGLYIVNGKKVIVK